jgi:tRNA (guanine-N7-)-methyltransferase
MMDDHSLRADFKYKHDNPYHDKLGQFDNIVMRDNESEVFRGKWNTEVFKREGPLFLEVGSGAGHFMMEYCQKNPSHNFVGLDYRFKRSFSLAKKLAKLDYRNFRYLRAKGERVDFIFNENELDGIFYFFPDPWPKTKHLKKRLFQGPFLEACYKSLKPNGILYVKTDHDGYAEWMEAEILKFKKFKVILQSKDLRSEYPDHLLSEYITGFEKIFISQGIKIKAFVLQSNKEV